MHVYVLEAERQPTDVAAVLAHQLAHPVSHGQEGHGATWSMQQAATHELSDFGGASMHEQGGRVHRRHIARTHALYARRSAGTPLIAFSTMPGLSVLC
eukprot:COSAG01_NODE_5768_length_4046_cov_1.760578_1_plen_97_part_10